MHEDFQCLNAVLPLLTKYRGSGRIHAVIQEEFASEQTLLDGWKPLPALAPLRAAGITATGRRVRRQAAAADW